MRLGQGLRPLCRPLACQLARPLSPPVCASWHARRCPLGAPAATPQCADWRIRCLCAQGWASRSLPPSGQAPPGASMAPLLDTLLQHVPPPPGQRLDGEAAERPAPGACLVCSQQGCWVQGRCSGACPVGVRGAQRTLSSSLQRGAPRRPLPALPSPSSLAVVHGPWLLGPAHWRHLPCGSSLPFYIRHAASILIALPTPHYCRALPLPGGNKRAAPLPGQDCDGARAQRQRGGGGPAQGAVEGR